VRRDSLPASKEEQQNGPVTRRARGGFAQAGGNMVTRKASVRLVLQRIGGSRRRSKRPRQIAYDVVSSCLWKTFPLIARMSRAASSWRKRVQKVPAAQKWRDPLWMRLMSGVVIFGAQSRGRVIARIEHFK